MIDKLFLSIVITLLLGSFLHGNMVRVMPSQDFSVVRKERIQTARIPLRPTQSVD